MKHDNEIKKQINSDYVCDWFVGNKLSMHFGKDKTKSILFANKRKVKSARKLNENIKI